MSLKGYRMKLSLEKNNICKYTSSQLNFYFPDNNPVDSNLIGDVIDSVLERVKYCFSFVNNKYFFDGKDVIFNHLNTDQYSMYLYILSNEMFKVRMDAKYCEKVFYLNKILHGIDAFYSVELPDIFLFVHPLGAVVGNAKYSDFFIIYQRCGVGSNKNIYPSLGQYVSLHPGSSVLGNCTIGNNCKIGAGSLIIDKSLESNSIYVGTPASNRIFKSEEILNIWKKS